MARKGSPSSVPTCSNCGLERETSEALLIHKSSCVLEPTADGYYFCRKVGCAFKTKFAQSLKTHVAGIHIKSKLHSCELCDYRTVWKVAMAGHYENKHNGEGLEAWLITCEVQKLRHRREQKATKQQAASDPTKPKRRYRRRSQRNSLGESVASTNDTSNVDDLHADLDCAEMVLAATDSQTESGSVCFDYEYLDFGYAAPEPVVIEHDFIMQATDFASSVLML